MNLKQNPVVLRQKYELKYASKHIDFLTTAHRRVSSRFPVRQRYSNKKSNERSTYKTSNNIGTARVREQRLKCFPFDVITQNNSNEFRVENNYTPRI